MTRDTLRTYRRGHPSFRFLVCPAWHPDDEADDSAFAVEAHDAVSAAEEYVEYRHSDLDYPTECTVKVTREGEGKAAAWVEYDVMVAAVPSATATKAKGERREGRKGGRV